MPQQGTRASQDGPTATTDCDHNHGLRRIFNPTDKRADCDRCFKRRVKCNPPAALPCVTDWYERRGAQESGEERREAMESGEERRGALERRGA